MTINSPLQNVWIMKTHKEWFNEFLVHNDSPYIAMDEPGFEVDYGKLSEQQRKQLVTDISALYSPLSATPRRWGQIRRFFDQFYDELSINETVILGTGQRTKFFTSAIVRVKSNAIYNPTPLNGVFKHRRNIEVLWLNEQTVECHFWGWANRIEKLDNVKRLREFVTVYTQLIK
jgi:hypothetical protein